MRFVLVLAFSLLLGVSLPGTASAQKLECQPQNTCKRPVEVLPTPLAYVTALACEGCNYLYPDPRSPEIELRIKRDKNEAYSLGVSRSAWNPGAQLSLEARYTLEGGGTPTVLEWRPLTESRLNLLNADDKRTKIRVEYRLKVTGSEPVGSFEASVAYLGEDSSANKKQKDKVSHNVLFVLGPALVLRLQGAAVSGATDLVFDVREQGIAEYLEAVTKGKPLAPSTVNLQEVSVFSNYLNGYSVTAQVAPLAGPANSSLTPEALWVRGASLQGQTFTGLGPTGGFVPLVTGTDYGLRVIGTEKPGDYRFSVSFEAVANP